MEQDDFEEGEILDSDEDEQENKDNEESKKSSSEEEASDKEPDPDPLDTYTVITRPSDSANNMNNAYRQRSTLMSNSDNDNDSSATSDEDTDLWKLKKSKYFSKKTDNKDVQLSSVIKSPIRASTNGVSQNGTVSGRNINFGSGEKRKRQNNVWGSVLTEQSLTQTMGSIGVERKDHVLNSYRNVEAYDYLQAHEDDRSFDEETSKKPESVDPFQKVIDSDNEEDSNKRGHKRRKKQHNKHHDNHSNKRQKRYRTCNPDDSDETVVQTIVENLREEKPYLVERILGVIGKEKAIELMYATEDIEEEGGMKTFDGKRRRTPGGVYIQLIKQDKNVTKDMVDEIFAEEQKKYKKELKAESKKRQRDRRKLMKMLPQNRLLHSGNKARNERKNEATKDLDEGEMETGDAEKKLNTSLRSNDEDFLNQEEEQLDIILGDEMA
ncbi:phosphorylated adapter RNA export protein-like [Mytilus californianus]|uniref:phosphorylated adapter RNA export protein-like n=1 Tax=Mytilus californianus TaxID=6549 RepID=UPI002245D6AC|nr:phosphorylated adapter RNA export protein-like [Mytilus californianus]